MPTSRLPTPATRLRSTGRQRWFFCWRACSGDRKARRPASNRTTPERVSYGQATKLTAQRYRIARQIAPLEVYLASSWDRHCRRRRLPRGFGAGRLLGLAPRLTRHEGLLPRRKRSALVRTWNIERFGNVRYQRHHAAGLLDVRVWGQKRLNPLALADVQPDIPDGVFIHLAATLECDDRRRVDRNAFRTGSRSAAGPRHCRDLCIHQHRRLLHLRLQRYREICGHLSALAP